ncbi:MAG: phytanoyl-CoA dioxygenase family protein [Alphaproteobacteria bacterium]|nr:phytanoyl-CoA dioxygenase family protein [Alphaproteobacteria bacterium]
MTKPAITGKGEFDMAAARTRYRQDGVVFVPGALSPQALQQAQAAFDWSLANPGPLASKISQHSDALFYQDLNNLSCLPAYREMLLSSPLPRLVADLWGTPDVWFMYEQVFLKEGGESRRTPWHQDSSYLSIGGDDLAVVWITFDSSFWARTRGRSMTAPASNSTTIPHHSTPAGNCRGCPTSRPTGRITTSPPGRWSRAMW